MKPAPSRKILSCFMNQRGSEPIARYFQEGGWAGYPSPLSPFPSTTTIIPFFVLLVNEVLSFMLKLCH